MSSVRVQALAELELRNRFGGARPRDGGVKAQARRRPDERRGYADDPLAYFFDVLGWELTAQQEAALDLVHCHPRVLLPSANNMGKTFVLGGYGVFRIDAVAALEDDYRDLPEQGGRVLLPGPDHPTIFATVYDSMLEHAGRAERRGHLMPGVRSHRSVNWRVREGWTVEAFSPPKKVGQNVAHTASGRHHQNQVALIEEGQGVPESLWLATEGMCSSQGNKVVSSFNPTEPIGPAYQRARGGAYRVLHLDAFEHPNLTEREYVVPGAVDYLTIDARVRSECRDRGRYPSTVPDEEMGDFLYALAPLDTPERGPRDDGVLGHPDGEIHIYRPSPTFTAQVRGRWPESADTGLFDPGAWDKAVERWRRRTPPADEPDRVGLDCARRGSDDSCAVPAWGDDADTLLRAFAVAQQERRGAVDKLRGTRRAYVGECRILQKGDGPDVASQASRLFPHSPFNVDEGGVGASAFDHLNRVLGRQAAPVSFAASPPEPTPGEPWSENLRTAMYVRAARLVNLGLVDVPDDPLLREEILAHELIPRSRTVGRKKRKERKPSVLLLSKDDVKEKIGRSPDRADGFVLSLHQAVIPEDDASEWTTLNW